MFDLNMDFIKAVALLVIFILIITGTDSFIKRAGIRLIRFFTFPMFML